MRASILLTWAMAWLDGSTQWRRQSKLHTPRSAKERSAQHIVKVMFWMQNSTFMLFAHIRCLTADGAAVAAAARQPVVCTGELQQHVVNIFSNIVIHQTSHNTRYLNSGRFRSCLPLAIWLSTCPPAYCLPSSSIDVGRRSLMQFLNI